MSDRAIGVIGGAAEDDINFSWFRNEFKADNGLKDSLESGHVVIDTVKKLDQYLYTYGLMIESQWKNVAPLLSAVTQPNVLIDYGCGQGLAGLLLNDLTQGRLFGVVQDIILIEPSAVALARAEALYQRIAPSARLLPSASASMRLMRVTFPPGMRGKPYMSSPTPWMSAASIR